MIVLDKITKKYKHNLIFDNVSISFSKGKKILIKGINGIGKSVLLRIIVGYSTLDSGKVTIDSYQLRKDGDFIKNAGVSINAPEFNKNISGKENLLYLSSIRGVADETYIDKLVNYFGLSNDINKKYKTYSLGMKQKLRLIQALMDKPEYLILDEPFDALDYTAQKLAINILNKYMETNKDATIIYTTHNTSFQDDFADEVFEISDNKIKQIK